MNKNEEKELEIHANEEGEKLSDEDAKKQAEELVKQIGEAISRQKKENTRRMFHQPTPAHSDKKRGVGITRASHEESKKAKKLGKSQRKINQKRANKKSRPTGSKQRK